MDDKPRFKDFYWAGLDNTLDEGYVYITDRQNRVTEIYESQRTLKDLRKFIFVVYFAVYFIFRFVDIALKRSLF